MRFSTVLFLLLLQAVPAIAQDTLRLSIRQSDSLLVQRSLALVVHQLAIDQAEAERVQARLFHNPEFSSEWVVGGPGTPFVKAGATGQKILEVEQLFRIAGQRSLAIQAATDRLRLNEALYAEFASALRLHLHDLLYRQYFVRRSLRAIASQLDLLHGLQQAYGQQHERGNVSLRELTRLRTAFFALNAQRIDLLREANELQRELRELLVDERVVIAAPTPEELELPDITDLSADTLVAKAQRQRHLVRAAEAGLQAAELDLKWQRRLAIPDLALGVQYNHVGDLHPKQTAVSLNFSIPLFDRNQGNIQWAKAASLQAGANRQLALLQAREEVLYALQELRILHEQYESTSPGFSTQLDELSDHLVDHYTKSNIKLLEFTDLFESYNTTIIELNQLMANLHHAYEQLEFAVGERLFQR